MRILDTFDELASLTGQELGTSDWLEIDQDRVNGFADATGDNSGSTSTSSARPPAPSAAPSRTAT